MSDMILFFIWTFGMFLWGIKVGLKYAEPKQEERDFNDYFDF